jgi:hypothetical protein
VLWGEVYREHTGDPLHRRTHGLLRGNQQSQSFTKGLN